MIRAYTGRLGDGKTFSMIEEARRLFASDLRQVYSDIVSLHFPEAVYMDAERPELLAAVSSGLVLLDEAHILFSARYWQSVPRSCISAMTQSRKNGLDLFLTTQNIDFIEKTLRDLVNERVQCRQFRVPGFGGFIVQSTFGPGDTKPIKRRIVRLRPRTMALYDTLEVVGARVGVGLPWSETLEAARDRRAKRGGRRGGNVSGKIYESLPMAWDGNVARVPARSRKLLTNSGLWAGGPWASRADWAVELTEIRARERWLAEFGIKGHELPMHVTYANPWAKGLGPSSLFPGESETDGRESAVKPEAVTRMARAGSVPEEGFTADLPRPQFDVRGTTRAAIISSREALAEVRAMRGNS